MTKLTQKLDMLRSDGSLKTAIESYQPRGFFDFSATRGGTAEFQLAALIVILELYKHEAPYNNTNRSGGQMAQFLTYTLSLSVPWNP